MSIANRVDAVHTDSRLVGPKVRDVATLGTATERSRGRIRVIEIDVHNDGRYEDFVNSQPSACIFHHPGWLKALEAEYQRKLIVLACEGENGDLQAVLPIVHTRGVPFTVGRHQVGRRLSSLPRTPVGGPVFIRPEYALPLLQAAIELTEALGGVQLQIKSQMQLPTELVHELISVPWRPTYVLEIPNRTEELRFGDARNRHNIKWAVKKAEQNGMTVRPAENESELVAWYPLYLQTMRRNLVPARPLRLFVAMWRNLVSRGLMRLQLAERKQDNGQRVVAGSIFLTFADTTWYAFTGIGDKDLGLHANDLILWHSINEFCGTGVRRFDFGEVSEDHPELVRFKTKWGARPQDQYRYYSSDPPVGSRDQKTLLGLPMQLIRRIWQRLPLRVTEQLGDWIYSRL